MHKLENIYYLRNRSLPMDSITTIINNLNFENVVYILSDTFNTLNELKEYIVNNSLLQIDDVNNWIHNVIHDNYDNLYESLIIYKSNINNDTLFNILDTYILHNN